MASNVWEADKMLDSYIYDYLLKRNLQNTAKAFEAEAQVSSAPVSIDAPGGFLFEWWSVFWDIFIARTNDKHSDAATSYLESIKARERTQLPQQQIQMQQLLLQKRAQQQQHQNMQQQLLHHQQQEHLHQHRRQQKQQQHDENGQFSTSDQDILLAADSPRIQNSAPADSLSSKIYEERMKVPAQREALDEAANKQRFTESSGQLLDSNLASMLKSASVSAQASGQIVHGPVSGISGSLQQAQARNQRLQGSVQDTKAETNVALNLRTMGDGSLIGVGVPGSNQAGNNLTLKGWPLTGVEHLRSGFLQHKSFMQSPQQLQHLQFLTPQQQQVLLQTQQSMTSSHGDMDNRRLRVLFGSRNLVPGRDSQSNSFAEIIPSSGPSLQNIGSPMRCMESDILMKKIAALQQHQQTSNQQQLLHHPLLTPLAQNPNDNTGEQGKMVAGTVAVQGNLSNSFHGNEQFSKKQSGRKRKQRTTASGPADSSGTANTTGPSPSSSPSTPYAHSPEDTVSTPSLHHNASLSKALVVYGADAPGSIGSPTSQLVHMVDDDCLKDNMFLPHDEVDGIDAGSHCINSDKGSILREISSARASTSSVLCCHFSSDGKLLATGGHDKKVVLWDTETLKQKSTLEEHSALISDVRFSPCIPRIATSSFDKTIRVWDADKPDYSVRTFTGHFASVMSLDFHPIKDDLICSCDGNNEMRFWSINDGRVVRIVEGGSTQLRFQPRFGGYLATASDNVVSILDVETQACLRRFEGHTKHVDALCWDPSGECVVSVSEDTANIWSLKMGNEERPYLSLWDLSENRTMTISAHDGLITSLAASSSGMVASTGHDKHVKLWGSPLPIAACSNR
ncbi:hypothetical protein EJB05_31218 [Eragrostis curvula]|uniref:LisH domain-containing protein n=1 Tax=Eragrostis curvula TaxID=38414 RepID=A0A5J9UCZ4_9POAL|nr:hypothetical protein EJB05_31218 [Eragrostis curvula]